MCLCENLNARCIYWIINHTLLEEEEAKGGGLMRSPGILAKCYHPLSQF